MLSERPRRIAPWLALCLVVPLAAGTAPGSYQSEATGSCTEIPCLLWEGVHEGPEDKAIAHHLVLSPDGQTAYIVGGTSTWLTFTDLVTWAVDVTTGELIWSAVYNGGSGESELSYHDVRAIAVSPDGSRVTVAGTSQGSGQGDDIVTLAYDAATGAQLWMDRYHGGSDSDEDIATAIAVDRTGTYVLTAGVVVGKDDSRKGVIIGYDLATSDRLWELPFSSPCWNSHLLGMKATPASSAIFVGGLRSSCLSDSVEETPHDLAHTFTPTIWAVDPATGEVLWEAQDDDPLLTFQTAMPLGALEATEESVVLSSRITNPRNSDNDLDVLTMAVDLEGEILWRARYDSMGRDDLLGIKAAPDGSHVYVVAASPAVATAGVQDQNLDIVVTAYDGTSGAVAWTSRLDSSTTGATFDGARLGGEGDDDAILSAPALFDSGTRLAIGYTAWFVSPIPILGPSGPNAHVLAVLDTSDGSVAAVRTDEASLEEYSYAAMHDRADLVGIGSYNGESLDSAASFRRLSLDVTPPDLNLPGSVAREAAGPDGAVVSFTATATDDRDGDVAVTCSPASGTTFPLGTTGVSCSASDSYGNVATGSFEVRVRDTTPPTLHLPDGVEATATSRHGAAVEFTASAQDLVDTDVPASCSHAPGQTFPPGTTRVSCDATDAEGNQASSAFDVVVTYAWTGFQDPVQADGSSEFRHGRTVPVKVELTGASADITDAVFRLWVQTEGGVEVPAVGHGSSSNRLAYDDETGTYRFLWNTTTVLPGDHRLRLDLGDGTQNVVAVRLI